MPTAKQIHIFGCGDIGRRVAQLCLQAERSPTAWVKTTESAKTCQAMGLKTRQHDFDTDPQAIKFDRRVSILYTVPPPQSGICDTRLQSVLPQLQHAQIEKFVLISTSGVYGDCGGRWIDESTPIRPFAARAQRRAHAELSLLKWAKKWKVDTVILRVPGIYAADRLPVERIKRGLRLVKRCEAPWTNRIHADDLATACFAALTKPVENEIINVIDDQPSTMIEYFEAAADYANLPRPVAISLQAAQRSLSPGMQSYLGESRRIKNEKMKRLLKFKLRYPTLAEGLARPD